MRTYTGGMEQTIRLEGISPRAWEHPADRAAMASLRAVPGLQELIGTVLGRLDDTSLRLFAMATGVRTGKRQLNRIHQLLEEAALTLDLKAPELYVSNHPAFNAMALGLKEPVLVLNSGLVESLTDPELAFIIGHELGHVASGHSTYRTLLWLLQELGNLLIPQGIPQLLGTGLWLALLEWYRKAELSCDRAGLLAIQDPAAAWNALMRMAGGRGVGHLDQEAFLEQAAEFQQDNNILESVLKLLMTLGKTHPFPVARFAELRAWHLDGSYQRILDGAYPRRQDGQDGASRLAEDLGALGDQMGKSVKDGLAQLDRLMGDLFGRKGS